MITVALTLPLFICWSIGILLMGVCVGGLIIYKIEENDFKAMKNQCESLAIEEGRLRREREEHYNTRDMIDVIDDVPEYLRARYDISDKQTSTDVDENVTDVYV